MRVATALILMVTTWKQPVILSLATGVIFFAFFELIRLTFVKFVPRHEATDNEIIDDCALQYTPYIGFVPFLGLAAFIICFVDMVYDPLKILMIWDASGSQAAHYILGIHIASEFIHEVLLEYQIAAPLIAGVLLILCGILNHRINEKKEHGLVPLFGVGDGDSYVIGALAMMFGGEIFFFVLMMGAIVMGEIMRVIFYFRNRRLAVKGGIN